MNEVAIVAMAFVAIAVISYPILRPKLDPDAVEGGEVDESVEDSALDSLVAQRDGVYAAIREIEFDRQIGNLSEGDYHDLRDRYKAKALATLKSIHDLEVAAAAAPRAQAHDVPEDNAEVEDEIEAAVRQRRGRRQTGPIPSACPVCGTDGEPGANFCSGCGSPVEARCENCGEPHSPADKFCADCGARLAKTRRRALSRA